MINHIFIVTLAFAAVWIGSGLAASSVERLSRILKVSSFAVSFLVLGAFTSVSEFAVGLNAVIEGSPEIYVGNLIGASIILFMLIIPLLAIVGSRIRINPEFQGHNLPLSLIVIATPVLLSIDGRITHTDALISIVLFCFLVLSIQTKRSLWEKVTQLNNGAGIKISIELIRIIFGVVLIFIASRFLVDQTLYFSSLFNISPFIISLLVISLGTNIPELSMVVRSVFMHNHQIAFGNYVGSASFNTLIFGILSYLHQTPVRLTNSYLTSLLFLLIALSLFYYFARTKNTISRQEGLILLSLYIAFIASEIYLYLLLHRS